MEQEKLFKEKGKFQGFKALPEADTRRVIIRENGFVKLDVNVSGTTIAVANSGINEENVHEWLWELGMKFLERHDVKYAKLLVTSDMVMDGKLKVPLEAIIKEAK